METVNNSISEKVKSGYLVTLLVVTGIMSGVTAVLISYPALAFLASKVV
jgi:hypothetical protein